MFHDPSFNNLPVFVPGARGGDLTIIQNFQCDPRMIQQQMYANQQQEAVQAMMIGQRLMLERMELQNAAMRQRLTLSQKGIDEHVQQLEDKQSPQTHKTPSSIDVPYEIIDEGKETKASPELPGENVQEEENMVDGKQFKQISDSLEKQIASMNAVPVVFELTADGSTENVNTFSPVIFTIRNQIWRDRTRYIMKEYFSDKKRKVVVPKQNQENPPCTIVVLHNKEKKPVDIVVIMQMEMDHYLSDDESFINHSQSIKYFSGKTFIVSRLVNLIVRDFSIDFKHYHLIFEPIIDNEKTPAILNHQQTDDSMAADVIRIKPVLSFSRDIQAITVGTYVSRYFTVPIQH
jgi:hypothetical protein